ncbi:hypothetical protein DID75_02510 [Candidatus Marinamargulisbacteria bacterium SCGC AG-410-N11]|nr:hypothetical protein DID75_02510 [Candidatus Marinamargulisbacteria bacterium SCGC AG-410-N11]
MLLSDYNSVINCIKALSTYIKTNPSLLLQLDKSLAKIARYKQSVSQPSINSDWPAIKTSLNSKKHQQLAQDCYQRSILFLPKDQPSHTHYNDTKKTIFLSLQKPLTILFTNKVNQLRSYSLPPHLKLISSIKELKTFYNLSTTNPPLIIDVSEDLDFNALSKAIQPYSLSITSILKGFPHQKTDYHSLGNVIISHSKHPRVLPMILSNLFVNK